MQSFYSFEILDLQMLWLCLTFYFFIFLARLFDLILAFLQNRGNVIVERSAYFGSNTNR